MHNCYLKTIDKTGKFINDKYERYYECNFDTDLIAIKKNGKYGYIDSGGDFVIKPKYQDAKDFSDKVAAIKLNNKWGYINHDGEFIIKPQFELAENFSDSFAAVKTGNKYKYIDKNGTFIEEYTKTYQDFLSYIDKIDKPIISSLCNFNPLSLFKQIYNW